MATITTYTELTTAIGNWAARTDTAFTDQYDTFIDLTEAQLRGAPEDGGYRGEITRASGSVSTLTLAIPSDFLEPFRFEFTGDSGGLVEFIGREQMSLATRNGNGKPRFWTVTDVIEFDVTPDTGYPYELSYYANITALTGTASTNTILTNYPQIYLSGCMFHAHRFLQDPEGAAHWGSQYRLAVKAANREYERRITSRGPIASKIDGKTP